MRPDEESTAGLGARRTDGARGTPRAADVPGRRPSFATVVLDVDSTVSGIEGLEWLTARRGAVVADQVAQLTADAVRDHVPAGRLYGERLARVRPTRADVDALGRAYLAALAPGVRETVRRLRHAGVHVVLLSRGPRHALFPLAAMLDVAPADVHAVSIHFDALGAYAGYDAASPLAHEDGKREVVAQLGLEGPVLAVGDEVGDLAMRDAVDSFAAFTGFVRRDAVVSDADVEIASFSELIPVVLE